MRTVRLGRTGPAVGVLGLGCMGMSPGVYGPVEEAESEDALSNRAARRTNRLARQLVCVAAGGHFLK